MSGHPTPEELMGYLDGELDAERRVTVQDHLGRCTECRREQVIFGRMKEELATMRFSGEGAGRSVWDAVNRRLTRPTGWLLFVGGLVVWAVYAVWLFVTSPARLFEKLTIGAIAIGAALLLTSVLWERYREWRTDPYRKIER